MASTEVIEASSSDGEVFVRRHVSGALHELTPEPGGLSQSPNQPSYSPDVAVSPRGDLCVSRSGSANQVHVACYDADGWRRLGVVALDGEPAFAVSHGMHSIEVSDDGVPYVAMLVEPLGAGDSRVGPVLVQHDGSTWQQVGGDLSPWPHSSRTFHPPALGWSSGAPVMAWVGEAGNGRPTCLLARARDGQWQAVSRSLRNVGISNSEAACLSPSLAARDNRACLAWVEFGKSSYVLLVRCSHLGG